MRARRIHPLVPAIVALAMALAACNGDDNNEARDSTTTEATTTTSTTTTTQPTTTTFPIEGPEPWTEVVRDLWARQTALKSDPDPSAVAAVFAESSNIYQDYLNAITDLAAKGQHIEGDGARPVAVVLQSSQGGNTALQVKIEVGETRLVDANGNVIESIPPAQRSCVNIIVVADGPSGAHRIHDYFVPLQCPEGL
ncbi:MAG: hypothetical protein ACRD0A_07445 [Acidimicrobiales bacterium]